MNKTIDALAQALEAPGCERIKDFYSVGPVQRAAVEQFVEALAQARAEHAKPVLSGRWHHGQGVLCSGSLRIARADFDTNPPLELQAQIFDDICAAMNRDLIAQLATPAPKLEPCGVVESAVRGCEGYHVRVWPGQPAPRVGTELYTHPPAAPVAKLEPLTLEELDAAFQDEIRSISTAHYNSNEICRHFYSELRKRLEATHNAKLGVKQ